MRQRDTRLERIMETNQQWQDRRTSEVRLSFERKVARKLLDAGGVDRLRLKVMESQWDNDANRGYYLTFGWLAEEYPNFPFILTAAESTWQPRAVELFMSSAKSCKLWNLWRGLKKEFSKEVAHRKQIAMMVPCSQESGLSPAIVIHNGVLPDGPFPDTAPNQTRLRLVEPRTSAFVFVQHLSYFSAQVALQWQA